MGQNTTTALQDLATQFANTTIDQNETLQVLQTTLYLFQTENDRLEDFNTNLKDGLEYLNTTLSDGIDTSLEDITVLLGEQVQQQQSLTLTQLEISYRQLIQNWDCEYRNVFGNEPYGQNYDIPMIVEYDPDADLMVLPSDVHEYITDRVLSKLCVSSDGTEDDDFLRYLQQTNTDVVRDGIISKQLIRSVLLYTDDAMRYYFPPAANTVTAAVVDGIQIGSSSSSTNDGVPIDDWVDAGFRCELLPNPYRWSSTATNDNINLRQRRRQKRKRKRRLV